MNRLRDESLLLLYLATIYQVMSSVLVHEIDREKKPMYFVRKVFKVTEAHYHKIEKLTLPFVVAARKL